MKRIRTSELLPGMVTAEDILNYNGQMILPKGLVLTDRAITRLVFYSIVSVRVEDDMKVMATPMTDDENTQTLSQIIQSTPDYQVFKKAFETQVDDFKNAINDIVEKNAVIDVDAMLNQSLALINSSNGKYSVFEMLHNMRQYDDLTFAHCMNVSLICNVFAGWLKMDEEETKLVTLCGLFHDIGKLKIPDSIIKKPAKLTDSEYNIIKTHTVEGYNILKQQNINIHIMNSALMHHEKCDGSGYPFGLTAEKIDRYAKIVGIVDVYDAMTSARIYRGPLCPFRVVELFESEGLQKYDTHFILTFLENIVNTYLHNTVRLSNGDVGELIFNNKQQLSKPIIKCGTRIIDLSKESSISIDAIL